MSDVRMKGVYKRFGKVKVIENVDLDVEDGEFTVFVGPSGCGKSTLLRLVAGLEDITGGDLNIGGKRVNDLPPAKRGVSMVFQSYALYPHMTVYENMAFGLKLAKQGEQDIKKRVENAAEILQLSHLLERLPKELSGGQRQRVAIGRAIVREPGVFLFDEPLSNLDAALRVQTRIEIAKLHASLGASMIYVTHDQVEAMTLADKILLLNTGPTVLEEGSVGQIGHPLELYHHPRNLFVAGFIGSPKMNFLPGELVEASANQATVRLADGSQVHAAVDASSGKPGDKVTLGIRPEHCEPGDASEDAVRGAISHVERLGESSFIYMQVTGVDELITLRQPGDSSAQAGENISMVLPPHHCHLFNERKRAFKRVIDKSAETAPMMTKS